MTRSVPVYKLVGQLDFLYYAAYALTPRTGHVPNHLIHSLTVKLISELTNAFRWTKIIQRLLPSGQRSAEPRGHHWVVHSYHQRKSYDYSTSDPDESG